MVKNIILINYSICHLVNVILRWRQSQKHLAIKVATSYVHTATQFFNKEGMDVEVIHLNGSVELSCVVDMVDAIVDIVQTGSTLTANGLVEKKYISEINAKLITNKESYFKQSSEIERLIKQLGVSINYA